MQLTAVTAAAQLLLSFKKVLNDAREHAETSKDIQLKQHINTAYDQMMELKEAVARVVSENERVVSENEQLTGRSTSYRASENRSRRSGKWVPFTIISSVRLGLTASRAATATASGWFGSHRCSHCRRRRAQKLSGV